MTAAKQTQSVLDSLAYLDREEDRIRDAALAMLKADGGVIYSIDLLAIAGLNRALSQSAAFRMLIESRLFLAAAVLLRTQLDSALRFSAMWHVADAHEFARGVIGGKHVRNFRDRAGKKLTDSHLVTLQVTDRDWVPEVYAKTSAFVHFSNAHLAHAFAERPGDDEGFSFKIGAYDEDIPETTYLEAIAAFDAATDLFVELIEKWTAEKAGRTGIAVSGKRVGMTGDPAAIVRGRAT